MAQPGWIGQTLNDRYEIQELLGQGGMAAVYKGFDKNLKRVVAVKLIHSQYSSNEDFVRRFESEASTVAQLRHPNIIQVFDFNHDQDTYFIVFEFVPGETLQARMKRLRTADRQMEVGEAIETAAKTADALQYAHTKGLIHRDIKPANIMLNVYGEPIVMDFGIAKIMGGTQHTATGAVLGTARYMSPEQIKGDRIDPRTDIYSLGITLFEMLGGRPPFEADSAMTLMMMHMTDPVPDLRNLRADASPELTAAVNKSLAKDRNNRYETAAAMAYALRNLDSVPTASVTTIESTPAVDDPGRTVLDSAAAAAALGGAAATQPSPPAATTPASTAAPPPAPPRTPPQTRTSEPSGSGNRNLFIAIGAVAALIVIIGLVWFAFFRPSDGGGEPEASPVAEVTDIPEATAVSTTTPEPEATDAPPTATPEPEATATDPAPAESVAAVGDVSGQVVLVTNAGETAVSPDTPILPGSQILTGTDGEITLNLVDESSVGLTEESVMTLVELASDPADEMQSSIFQLENGQLLLSKPDVGNVLQVLDSNENPLASLQFLANSSAAHRTTRLSKQLQRAPDDSFMSVIVTDTGTLISCFSGKCSLLDSDVILPAGEETLISLEGTVAPPETITAASESYQYWQTACTDCLPEAPPPIVEVPPTNTPPPQPTATTAPTAEPTQEGPAQLSARITSISDNSGTYVINYETYGYTETLPGQHVHFFFDTVSQENAGVPGSGPWKLYGGPRPFTGYTVNDRPAAATSMCILVANEDHSIISGSGNCMPLP